MGCMAQFAQDTGWIYAIMFPLFHPYLTWLLSSEIWLKCITCQYWHCHCTHWSAAGSSQRKLWVIMKGKVGRLLPTWGNAEPACRPTLLSMSTVGSSTLAFVYDTAPLLPSDKLGHPTCLSATAERVQNLSLSISHTAAGEINTEMWNLHKLSAVTWHQLLCTALIDSLFTGIKRCFPFFVDEERFSISELLYDSPKIIRMYISLPFCLPACLPTRYLPVAFLACQPDARRSFLTMTRCILLCCSVVK